MAFSFLIYIGVLDIVHSPVFIYVERCEILVSKFQSLKKNREFQAVYREGKSKVNRCFVMIIRENDHPCNRVGISVSKKVGNSIVRHRVTRVVREVMRLHWEDVIQGYDIVIVARTASGEASYQKFESAIVHLLKKHHLLKEYSYEENCD